MARKLRLEFPGAIYHVINRGNYRGWIFAQDKTKTTQASNKWLTQQLRMGSPVAVSQYVGVLRHTDGEARRIFKRLAERLDSADKPLILRIQFPISLRPKTRFSRDGKKLTPS